MINTLKLNELNLSKTLLKALNDIGFKNATPIQSQAIPCILAGQDVIGQASTGTGKTAAFSIPAIEKIDPNNKEVQVLILCPTRELAIQVAVEIKKFLKYKKNIYALPIYGGQAISKQIFELRRGAQIIIGTPGRTLDHIERKTLKLNKIKMVILDEADEMLDMGFRKDIERILQIVPKQKQLTLFSATMSHEILRLTKIYQKNPQFIKITPEKTNISKIEHAYFDVEPIKKINALVHLINKYQPKLSIMFCNTRRQVDKVARSLRNQGYRAEGIHGEIRQAKRNTIMSKFRNNRINILVATDVAARGIDVPNVEIVFNYEIPKDSKSYIHRSGRTGRAGKSGKALSLVSYMDNKRLYDIKRHTKINISAQKIPNLNEIENISFKKNSKSNRYFRKKYKNF